MIEQENVSSKVKFKKASYLISLGADIGIKNNDGETARDMVKRLNMRTMEWNLQEAEKS